MTKKLREIVEHKDLYAHLSYHYPHGLEVYHETPGHVADSIKKNGLSGEYGIYSTIGQNSNFVTVPKKTITKFVIPRNHYQYIKPDMGYGTDPDLSHLTPEQDFLEKHGKDKCKGGDICYHGYETIPHSWIKEIKEVG